MGRIAGVTAADTRDRLLRAAASTGEQLWQLPLYEEFVEAMRGDISDLKNSAGREAGAGGRRQACLRGMGIRSTPLRANGRLNAPATPTSVRNNTGRSQIASASRLIRVMPYRATTVRRTSRI